MVHWIFLFFTYVVFFLHRQNIYMAGGVGQGIKLVGSKNFHVYVSVRWRHLNLKTKVVHSSVMLVLFTVL